VGISAKLNVGISRRLSALIASSLQTVHKLPRYEGRTEDRAYGYGEGKESTAKRKRPEGKTKRQEGTVVVLFDTI